MEEVQSLKIDGQEEVVEEFYEKIEAPKFVDFTVADQCRPDDRYWFCLRVGCDQKHEEEMDSEEIYKSFVLRVMAARSPNIRLRKALNREAPRNVKCPLTAPPKSSKPRISRLALISSISQKVIDTKLKGRPPPKLGATPNSKPKQSSAVAKAFTTPRNRKRLSNPSAFRSVRNIKATTNAVPKNRVAKALVFHSPKKAVKLKTSVELKTPVRTICSAMKKLEITSGKKHVLAYNKPLPVDASRKQLRGREVKSRVFDSLRSQSCRGQEAKSSRCLKRKINEQKDLKHFRDPVPHEGDDSSDMDIDEKSRGGSFEGGSVSGTSRSGEGHEECLDTVKSQKSENSVEVLSDTSRGDINFLTSSEEERDSGENDIPNSQALSVVAEGTSEKSDHEEKMKSISAKGKVLEVMQSDDKENALACDDKENASASDDNREKNHNNDHHERRIQGKHEASKISQKVIRVMDKSLKEGPISAATGAQGVKYRKPKPTNPKPFRLRTDERGILKEANLERKLFAPLKEITTVPKLPHRNSQRNHQNAIQKSRKCLGQSERKCDTHEEGGEKKLERTQEDQSIRIGTTCSKASKGEVKRKFSLMTPHRRTVSPVEPGRTAQKSEDSLKNTKSPMVQQKLTRPRGVASSKKEMISIMSPGQLGVIKETSSTILTPKEAAKPSESGASPGTEASASTASRSLSRGRRRPPTIPKEPNFHSIHVPKSCTRKLA